MHGQLFFFVISDASWNYTRQLSRVVIADVFILRRFFILSAILPGRWIYTMSYWEQDIYISSTESSSLFYTFRYLAVDTIDYFQYTISTICWQNICKFRSSEKHFLELSFKIFFSSFVDNFWLYSIMRYIRLTVSIISYICINSNSKYDHFNS